MFRSSPIKAFTIEDLPALGRPTTAKRGISSSKISNLNFKEKFLIHLSYYHIYLLRSSLQYKQQDKKVVFRN